MVSRVIVRDRVTVRVRVIRHRAGMLNVWPKMPNEFYSHVA